MESESEQLERGLLLVFFSATSSDREPELDEWFDETHLDDMLAVAGLQCGARFRRVDIPEVASPIEHTFVTAFHVEAPSIEALNTFMDLSTASTSIPANVIAAQPAPFKMWFREATPWRAAER